MIGNEKEKPAIMESSTGRSERGGRNEVSDRLERHPDHGGDEPHVPEPWVPPLTHPFVVLAKREGKNTEHAARSVLLTVADR